MIPTVKAVIQIVGFQRQPSSPQSNEEVRTWYQSVGYVHRETRRPLTCLEFATHLTRAASIAFAFSKTQVFEEARSGHPDQCAIFLHSIIPLTIFPEEERQVKLILTAMPAIKDYVQEALTDPLNNKTNKV